ncbi:MAG: histidinol-phosphate transaminase [Moraxella sp.]|nr:histidinol-phosphate transaminase [Moraxella sp.]
MTDTAYNHLLNPNILTLTPYVAGEQPKINNLTKLNTNENPYPPSPKVRQAIDDALGADGNSLRFYPDPDSRTLTDTIAEYFGVGRDCVFVGNGSDEVLGHVFRAFFDPARTIATPDIGYSFYPVYAKLFGLSLQPIALDDEFAVNVADYQFADGQDVGGIILANPNAPTGRALSLDKIVQLLVQNPHCTVVIDEAYVDFGAASSVALVADYPNLVVCQTTSKSRALAGMRVGYAIAQPHLIRALNTVKNCFNSYPLDRLAQAAAVASFADEAYFQDRRQAVMDSRAALTQALTELGFTVVPSMANFIFASHSVIAADVVQAKLRADGVIVRHFNKPIRITNHLRISIGNDDENARLIAALKQIVADM